MRTDGWRWVVGTALIITALMVGPIRAREPQSAASSTPSTGRDGQHDFDFNFGTWATHINYLHQLPNGQTEWDQFNGTVADRKVWNGRANLEEIEADGSIGHFEGLTLFLYNPQTGQWSQTFANSNNGTLVPSLIGEFNSDRRGMLVAQEPYHGRTALLRAIWSNFTPNSHHFEEEFSDDEGTSWHPNFVATLTRGEQGAVTHVPPVSAEAGQHDFDFNFGTWATHVSRLLHPLTGSTAWAEYDGTSVVRKVWNGRASLFELEVDGPAGHIEGVGLRLYNPQSHQWSLNWANSTDGTLETPMIGEFKNGRGEFYDQEAFNGRVIFVRNSFSDITPNSSRFEQAFSGDYGKTWEANWIMTFRRTKT